MAGGKMLSRQQVIERQRMLIERLLEQGVMR
jgi:hypothetical protein